MRLERTHLEPSWLRNTSFVRCRCQWRDALVYTRSTDAFMDDNILPHFQLRTGRFQFRVGHFHFTISAAGRDASAVGCVAKASQPASCGHILGARMRNSRSLIMMTWAHPPRQLQKMPRIEVPLLREIRLTCPCPCPCLCRHPTPRQSQRSP